MKRQRLLPFIAAVVVLFTVRPAAADTVLTGSVGRVFSGDVDEGVNSYGAAIGFMGEGIFGFEVEGTYTPDFFGETPDGTNNITTLMGNIIVGAPIGETARLYASGGVGLMKFRVPDADAFFDIDRNDFGVNAGAGVFVYFGQRIGARGDVRYFRDVRESTTGEFDVDLGGFHYWRGSVGLSFKF
jgi:outer membrane protein with beta-barrel domain